MANSNKAHGAPLVSNTHAAILHRPFVVLSNPNVTFSISPDGNAGRLRLVRTDYQPRFSKEEKENAKKAEMTEKDLKKLKKLNFSSKTLSPSMMDLLVETNLRPDLRTLHFVGDNTKELGVMPLRPYRKIFIPRDKKIFLPNYGRARQPEAVSKMTDEELETTTTAPVSSVPYVGLFSGPLGEEKIEKKKSAKFQHRFRPKRAAAEAAQASVVLLRM